MEADVGKGGGKDAFAGVMVGMCNDKRNVVFFEQCVCCFVDPGGVAEFDSKVGLVFLACKSFDEVLKECFQSFEI